MKAVFDHSREEAPNIRTFFFRPEKPVHYTSGQFAEWTLKHPDYDDRGVKRWFTISSSPIDELVSLTTKYNKERSSSFKTALFKLMPGDEILMSDPMGDFVLPKLMQTPMVFVAGGIGITPFHSMFEWLAANHEERPIKFIYGVHTEDEIVFQDTFEKAGVTPSIVVSEPEDSWGGERGRLSSELILGLGQPTEDTLIYLSGPEPMVEKLAKDLKRAGIRPHQLVVDAFPNYSSI
jgi:glycine betaine catabolism B